MHNLSVKLLTLCLVLVVGPACAATRPAVVELFTSEGCSSCPPAESYIGELAQRPDVLALAFHVDYWDDLGWRDRFGIAEATPRQRAYAKTLRLSSVYTPQVVIDGRRDFVGSDRNKIGNALSETRIGPPIEIMVRDGTVSIDVDVQADVSPSDVLLVAYQRSAVSAIGRGENFGRTMTEYNIVRSIRSLGLYDGRAQHYRADVSGLPNEATHVAVLIQSRGQGPVLAAASQSLR